jgi:predicted nucleic acid-binding protein
MSADTAYLDSSAFVKLVSPEGESEALEDYLRRWQRSSSSTLLHIEALRAAGVAGAEAVASARLRLRSVDLIPIDSLILEQAATIGPPSLRFLDAIHLTTALILGPDLGVIVTYDRRMADAAAQLGLPVAAPA